ncbi:MAG: SCP2 sterol-binding domain-containing protein [Acidobacteriota bacterium]
MLKFPSLEWVEAFGKAINASEEYKVAGKPWTFGVTAMVVKAQPDIGHNEDFGIWLDLHEGVCRDARYCTFEEAQTAPFCIVGEYARWKQVIHKELDPVKGMMQGKLKLKGNLQIIVRNVKAAQALVNCSTQVPTKFLDE